MNCTGINPFLSRNYLVFSFSLITYIQVLVKLCSKFHGASTVIQSVLPRVEEERNSELPSRIHRQGIPDGNEVLQALRHFAASNCQVTRVQKVANPAVVVVVSLRAIK
jgi:hypothetical protein